MDVAKELSELRDWLRGDRSRLKSLLGSSAPRVETTGDDPADLNFENHSNWNNAPYREGDKWADWRDWGNQQ